MRWLLWNVDWSLRNSRIHCSSGASLQATGLAHEMHGRRQLPQSGLVHCRLSWQPSPCHGRLLRAHRPPGVVTAAARQDPSDSVTFKSETRAVQINVSVEDARRRQMKHGVLVPVLLRPLFSAGDQSGAQSPAQGRSDEAPDAIFHTETNLALVSFQVVTTRNRFVEDLRAAEIELLEDGVPQKVALFEGGRLSGMEVHVMFDCSGSMWSSKWSKGVFDPRVFDANLLDEFPNVRIGIWGFTGSGLGYFTTPTRDPVKLGDAISGLSGMPPGDRKSTRL